VMHGDCIWRHKHTTQQIRIMGMLPPRLTAVDKEKLLNVKLSPTSTTYQQEEPVNQLLRSS
jgi:hypothetical protein